MYKDLDIDITDEASSTVIHVRGPVSARMCDVGSVFDQLGIDVISCSTMPSASSCDMTLVVVDRHDSQPLDDNLKHSVSRGLQRVFTAHSPTDAHSSKSGRSSSKSSGSNSILLCRQHAGADTSEQQLAGCAGQQSREAAGGQAADVQAVSICRSSSRTMAESIPVSKASSAQLGPSDAPVLEQRASWQLSWQGSADISLPPLPAASLLHPSAPPAAGEQQQQQQQPSVRFSSEFTVVPADSPAPLQRAGSGRPPKPALKIDIPSDSDSSRSNNDSSTTSNNTSSRPAGRDASSSATAGLVSNQVEVAQQQGGVPPHELLQKLDALGMSRHRAYNAGDDEDGMSSSDDEDGMRSISCRSGDSGSCAVAPPVTTWQRLNSRTCSDLLVVANRQQIVCAQRASDNGGLEVGEGSDAQLDCFGTQRSSMDAGLSAQGDSSRSLGSVDQDQQGTSRRMVPMSPGAASTGSSGGRSRQPPPCTPSRILLSPVAPDGSGVGAVLVRIPKSSSSDERRGRRASIGSQSVAATPRVPFTLASAIGLHTPLSARVVGGHLKQLSSSIIGPKPHDAAAELLDPLSPTAQATAAAAAAEMPPNLKVAAKEYRSRSSISNLRDLAAAGVASVSEKGDSSTPLASPLHVSAAAAAAAAAGRRLSDDAGPVSPRVPRTSPCSFHEPPPTPIHPAVACAAAFIETVAQQTPVVPHPHGLAGLQLLPEDDEQDDSMQLPACTSPQRSPYRLSSSPGFEGVSLDSTSPDAAAAAAGGAGAGTPATIPEGSEGQSQGSEGGSSSEEWWCGELTGLTVRDIMAGPVKALSADADMAQTKQLMMQHNLPGMLVDAGPDEPVMFLPRKDFLKAMMRRKSSRKRPHKPCVRDIMSPLLVVEAGMSIESCAQAMSEAGFQHAAVRDAAAVDSPAAADTDTAAGAGSSQTASRAGSLGGSIAEYVGLVSESAILRHLGLYADDMGAGDEQMLEEGMLGMPQSFRQHLGLDNSFDSSAGTETPLSSRSRVATPLLDSSSARDGGGGQQQQERQQSVSTDAGPSEQQLRQTSLVKLPDIVLAREGLGRQGSSASSMGSVRSGFAAAADGRKSAAGGISDDGATRSGSFALTATASESSNAALLDVQGAGLGAVEGPPDALTRYKHAASLWEVDMNDLEMIKRIGEGSFGEVMVATYRGTKVAVKRLRVLDLDDVRAPNEQYAAAGSDDSMRSSDGSQRAIGASQAAFRQFFEREIAILASIRHPNVVNFIGACHKPGQRCLVTEYCARGSLDQVLHKSGLTLDLTKRIEFALDIARGMACLHAQRPIIIHRDLKTANLLVSARFEIKVADFGLSRIKDASHLQVSRAGLEGTIEYCAPEVLRGEPYTERCDVYSFGVVLWELLLRQQPYSDAEVPVFLLMVNIGNGTLTLPEVPEEAATPGLVDLVNHCLSFSACDRPEFREVLAVLEAEYRGLRARQPPRLQHTQQQQQQSLLQNQQVHAGAVLRCDSSSLLAVNQQSPRITADSPDPGGTPYSHSPAGTLGASAYVSPALTPAGSYAMPRMGEQDGLQQQLWQQPSQQQQQPLQRHRLSQHDSGLQTASSGGSAAPSFGFGFQPGPQPEPAGTPQIQQPQFAMPFAQQQYQQVYSVPLPQIQPQQVYVTSACNSPRQQQPQQFAVAAQQQHQQQQQYVMPQLRVMSAFPSGTLTLQQQQQQQQQHHQQGQGTAGPTAAAGGTSIKPPRHKQQLSRARSMPVPQSVNWDPEDIDPENDEGYVFDNIQEESGGQDVLLFAEDSFGGVSNCSMTGYSTCPSGQLCIFVEPTSSTYGSSSAAGMMPYQQPQQQLLVTPNGQQVAVQQVPMQPVLIQQPGGQLQQVYIQQQPAFATLAQAPQQQQQPQQAARMLRGALGTPSPTPAVLGRAGTPLSSSPSPGLNPLVVMAAAGAARDAARREGSASGATSPRYTSSMFVTGAGHGHHSRSSSHGCSQEMPPLHLLQLSDMQAGSRSGSPQRTPVRSDRMSSDGGCGYTHSSFSNGPTMQQAPGQGQGLSPAPMVVNTAGPAIVAPLLLQRLDSLHRSGSSGCSPRCLHRSSSPGRQSTDQSGQLMGLLVPGYGPGPASGPSSPRSHSPRHERHTHTPPAAVAAVHHLYRPGSSRLAIQGSYELPPGAAAAAAAAAAGDQQQAASCAGAAVPSAVSGGGAGFSSDPGQAVPVYGVSVLHAQPAHVYHHQFPQALPAVLQTNGRRAPSLLRIDSNSRDRAISPFAMASGAMGSDHGSHGGSTGGGVPSGAGVPVAAAPAGTCSRTLSPFAAASSGGSSLEDVASHGNSNDVVQALDPSAAAAAAPAPAGVAAAGAAGYSSGRPPAPVRYVSPFAAAAGRQEDDGDTDAVFDTSAERNSRSSSPAPGAGGKQQTAQGSGTFKGAAVGAGSASGSGSAGLGSGPSSATRLASPFALMQQQESTAEQD